MKNIILLFGLLLIFSCTQNQRAKHFGGTETIELPKGEKLLNVTWKEEQIWYLVEDMDSNYIPNKKRFLEKSKYGILQGEVIFIESR
jgi:hypothetical protein